VGGLEQVGLYTAGMAILNKYVGMIFSAMSTDYYPRLTGVAKDSVKFNATINHQTEIALLIVAPIIIIFLMLINYVLVLFYSSKFIPANSMLQWMALGMVPKTISWALALTMMAKGDSKLWFWSELIAVAYMLGLNIVGYKYLGLKGVGISFLLGTLLYTLQVYFIARIRYLFVLDSECLRIIVISLLLSTGVFMLVAFNPTILNYFFASIFFILSSVYSLQELNKRIDLKDIFYKVMVRFKR